MSLICREGTCFIWKIEHVLRYKFSDRLSVLYTAYYCCQFAVNGLGLMGLLKYAYGGDIPTDTPEIDLGDKKTN